MRGVRAYPRITEGFLGRVSLRHIWIGSEDGSAHQCGGRVTGESSGRGDPTRVICTTTKASAVTDAEEPLEEVDVGLRAFRRECVAVCYQRLPPLHVAHVRIGAVLLTEFDTKQII
jgi:hypothetical protein